MREKTAPVERPDWMRPHDFAAFKEFRKGVFRNAGRRLARLEPHEQESFALLAWARRAETETGDRRLAPTFPIGHPRFPATPTRHVRVRELPGVTLLVKDESVNPFSGTHKDRMAWEVALWYHDLLGQKLNGTLGQPDVHSRVPFVNGGGLALQTPRNPPRPVLEPRFSMISSGNGATAVGRVLRAFGAPKLHAIVDTRLSSERVRQMENDHVVVHRVDLKKKILTPEDELRLTGNPNGVALSTDEEIGGRRMRYYDWLAYEAFRQKPHVIVVPYGTGELFNAMLYQHFQNADADLHHGFAHAEDPRLNGPGHHLRGMHIVGITAPVASVADKLGAPFLRGAEKDKVLWTYNEGIRQEKNEGTLGGLSCVENIEDQWLMKAHKVALANKITAEPSALAGLAWALKNKKHLKGARVLIVNTGKGVFERANDATKPNRVSTHGARLTSVP